MWAFKLGGRLNPLNGPPAPPSVVPLGRAVAPDWSIARLPRRDAAPGRSKEAMSATVRLVLMAAAVGLWMGYFGAPGSPKGDSAGAVRVESAEAEFPEDVGRDVILSTPAANVTSQALQRRHDSRAEDFNQRS